MSQRYLAYGGRHADYLGRALLHGLIPSPRRERGEQFVLIVDQADDICLFNEISAVGSVCAR
jgi:hypothetical protein